MRSAAIATALLLMFMPLVGADDHDEDGRDDDEHEEEREYQLQVRGDGASLELSYENGSTERSIEFEYDRDHAKVEFSIESETATSESEAEMEVQFHQLIEYEDENGNGRYDAGETIISAVQLSSDGEESLFDDTMSATWSSVSQQGVTSDNGVAGQKFSSTASFSGGSLRFDFYVFASEASLGAATVEPTEIKLDIVIHDYPYASSTSALGLFLESESEAEVEEEEEDGVDSDEDGVSASLGGGELLLFAWKDFATVDGEDLDVHTTVLESDSSEEPGEREHEELIVLSYPRGDVIVHDPTLGISSAASKGAPGVGVALIAVAIVAVAALVRRR